jgi:fucose permease
MTGILIGRLLGSRWLARLAPRELLNRTMLSLVSFASLWTVLALVAESSPSTILRIGFLALVLALGLSSATLFPALVSYTALRGRSIATTTIAAIGWTAGIGGTLMPSAAGLATEQGLSPDLVMTFVAGPILVAAILVTLHAVRHRTRAS